MDVAIEKIIEKNIEKFFNFFFNIFVYLQDDHRKDSAETQFRADFLLISCGGEKYWKKYLKKK